MSPDAVVFDLDDTLAVTERDRQTLLDETTALADTHDIPRSEYLDAHGAVEATETRAPIFDRLLDPDAEASPETVASVYRETVLDALEPVPGVAEMVRGLRRSYRVGLLTDGPLVAQQSKLDTLGWTDLFDAVVVTGDLPAGKPDERAFAAVCEQLDVAPADAVYVGDRPEVDVGGAAAIGMTAVQVLFEGGPDPHPAVDATIDRADIATHLPDLLSSL